MGFEKCIHDILNVGIARVSFELRSMLTRMYSFQLVVFPKPWQKIPMCLMEGIVEVTFCGGIYFYFVRSFYIGRTNRRHLWPCVPSSTCAFSYRTIFYDQNVHLLKGGVRDPKSTGAEILESRFVPLRR